MRGMKSGVFKGAVLVGALLGFSPAVLAGTAGAVTFFPTDTAPIAPLSDNVTYSTPAGTKTKEMKTFAGFTVGDLATNKLLVNDSGNTINKVSFKVTATVTDSFEYIALKQPEAYLPASCTWEKDPLTSQPVPRMGSVEFTCTVGQLKNGDSFQAFNVFYVAPEYVQGGDGDVLGTDKISMRIDVAYAEGYNGPNPVEPNSSTTRSQPDLVTLGTLNPTNIKSGVPKGGAKLFTGDAGIPKNEAGKKFTEALSIPDLSAALPTVPFTLSRVDVSSAADASCVAAGRLAECPTFKSTIAVTIDPLTGAATSPETRFDPASPVEFTYRIDASNLKMGAQKILSTVQILYSGPKYTYDSNLKVYTEVVGDPWNNQQVLACTLPNTPRTDGMPCLKSPGFCYKKNQTGGIADLEGDCEWTTISTGNGLIKLQ